MSITVHYLSAAEFEQPGLTPPLFVIGYGVTRPATLTKGCPFVRVAMSALTPVAYEVWSLLTAPTYGSEGLLATATTGDVTVALAAIDETPEFGLQQIATDAYTRLLDRMKSTGQPLIRLWNYLPHITEETIENGETMERYRRFNIGRHQAFIDRMGEIRTPPAASGLGSFGGPVILCALFGSADGRAVENPRQISAYNYPAQYGLRSPTFSRGTIAKIDGDECLFISGTASIVGHESVHLDDLEAQTHETIVNLNAVIDAAAAQGFVADPAAAKFKIYLRHKDTLHRVREILTRAFPLASGMLYVQADICRAELLMEVEAFCPGLA